MSIKSRKLFAILVIAMMLMTLLPMTAFAASDNSVDRYVTVTKGTNLEDIDKTPILRIKNKNSTFSDEEVFRLQLPSSATWNDNLEIEFDTDTDETVGYEITNINEQIVQVRVYKEVGDFSKDFTIKIPMNVTLKDSASGEQKVTIISWESAFSESTHIFAIVATGKTIATVGAKKTIRRDDSKGASIVLDETVAGALEEEKQEFRLRLPRGFEWCDGTEVDVSGFEIDGDVVYSEFGDRDLTVTFTIKESSSIRQSIVIYPVVKATRSASFGDVTVTITNRKGQVSNETGLLIGAYKDYGVDVEIEEVKEFYAGWLDDDYTTAKITLEEAIAGSFIDGRVIEFELPSWVMVREDFDIESDNNPNTQIDAEVPGKKNVNSFEYTVQSGDEELEFELPITINGTAAINGTQDIVLTIKGGGVEETELVIGKAVAPVTVEVGEQKKVFDVGFQKQDAPDITIVEAAAGAIRDQDDANKLLVTVKDLFADSAKFDSFDWEVEKGDIEISSAKIIDDGESIEFTVKAESEEASTIRLYNIKMTLDRTVPLGTFRMDVGGSAIVNNGEYDNGDFHERVARFDYIEVGTPIPGAVAAGEAVFTIDSIAYTLNGEENEMDVAPYIKDDRTFLPVRYVAYAVGISPEDILWDPVDRTVTIFKGDRIVQLTIDSKVMVVNGVNVNMDVAPEITDGRTMMPIRWVGQALGATINWDSATKTVTVEN